jgi:hypothetical protein
MSPILPSSAPVRRVRLLRVRASEAGAARRASIALADALHTASLPDAEGGRFVLIRRVELGRIRAHMGSTTLALLVERAVGETARRAVKFDQPGAAAAEAVAFPDRSAALVALARRHARHEPATDWLWERILPGWSAEPTRVGRWRILLEAAHTLECPMLTAAEIVHCTAADDAIVALLSVLSPAVVDRWMSLGGWEPVRTEAITAKGCALHSPAVEPILQQAAVGLGSVYDSRLVWLGVMLAVRERPARLSIATLPEQIAAALRTMASAPPGAAPPVRGRVNARDELAGASKGEYARPPGTAVDPEGLSATAVSRPIQVTKGMQPEFSMTRALPAVAPASEVPANATGAVDGIDELVTTSVPSACAGLLFFIHVLRRLGFPTHLAAHPERVEADFSLRLLYFIGRRAGMAEDDPLARTLARRMGEAARGALRMERDWRCGAWLAAVRGWCRRRAALEWRAVVRRAGRVSATRTQIDVFFEPRQADIALRRVALDVDPGWVPWLGCVVRVHYVASP